jgi:hypothetical protein
MSRKSVTELQTAKLCVQVTGSIFSHFCVRLYFLFKLPLHLEGVITCRISFVAGRVNAECLLSTAHSYCQVLLIPVLLVLHLSH